MGKIYTFNNKIVTINNKWCEQYEAPDPYNPLGLPSNTIRVRTTDGNPPNKSSSTTYETATLVSGTTDVYDVYKSGTNFSSMFYNSTNLVEVLGANTAGITSMVNMFQYCNQLASVATFNTSNVTNMTSMFEQCGALVTAPAFDTHNVNNFSSMFRMLSNGTSSALTAVPLYDTSSAVYVDSMFRYCGSVQSGALALYQQMSQQSSITDHNNAFYWCGKNTTTGAAELAQIPSSWGGTGA